MNPFTTPTFVFDPHDPSTSPGFVLVLRLPRRRAALNQLQSKTLDFFTGGRATGCFAVLLVGLTDLPSSEQTRQLHQLSHRWRVAVEAVKSTDDARRLGSWLLGEFHQLFHGGCEEAFLTSLQVACLRQMSQDAITEFVRQPMAAPRALALAS